MVHGFKDEDVRFAAYVDTFDCVLREGKHSGDREYMVAAASQNTKDLSERDVWVTHMLEHVGRNHKVESFVCERQRHEVLAPDPADHFGFGAIHRLHVAGESGEERPERSIFTRLVDVERSERGLMNQFRH